MKKLLLKIWQYSHASCRPENFIKKRLHHRSPIQNTYVEEHLLTAAYDFLKQLQNSSEQLLWY